MIHKNAKQYFDNHQGIDKLFCTADNLAFFDEVNAKIHAENIGGVVTKVTREQLNQEAVIKQEPMQKTMSAEDVLKEHIRSSLVTTNFITPDGILYGKILSAMEQYAVQFKTDAVDFAPWCSDNNWEWIKGSAKGYGFWRSKTDLKTLSKQDLYQLFLTSKNNR